ncbi:MAG: four helix bundle protein [Thermodesulfobacteriota bacterium]|nr:four helix bundle protein [Thermodesulfobacteriota bacterium]
MGYKFEKLEIWELALAYIDLFYQIAEKLPQIEKRNLGSKALRAPTSIALNTAEGSTGQSNAEQNRFIGIAIRSLVETVACLHLMKRRNYIDKRYVSTVLFLERAAFWKTSGC